MGIEYGGLGATVLLRGEKAGKPGALSSEVLGVWVEHVGYGAPARPRGQDALLGQCCWPLRVAQRVHQLDGGDVGAGARFGARGDQDLGAGREVRGAEELLGHLGRRQRRRLGRRNLGGHRIGRVDERRCHGGGVGEVVEQ